MKYCAKCLMPDTKPYIAFDQEGVCNACRVHQKKNAQIEGIDWDARKIEFERLVSWAKQKNAPFYDALAPVSGGKDSITQVHRLVESGLRVLAVNIDYGIKTEIGIKNLDCVPNMGANLIIFRPELKIHRKLIRIGLEDFGDPDLLSHALLHAYPLHVALRYRIPLVALGENSASEYGGKPHLAEQSEISSEWFDIYAANAGNTARKIGTKYGITEKDLWQYEYPSDLDKSRDTRAIFLSHFFHWSSKEHLQIAKTHGFEELDEPPEGTYRTFVGIDEMINRVHQYQKVLKFGYGRATDHACEDIRNGDLTRDEAKALVREHDLAELGNDIVSSVATFLGYSIKQFSEIVEQSRSPEIWKRNSSGLWSIPGHLKD